ncbi:HDOD domain [Solimicrobium silvestre]|uniref:HDOD domain n=2 Tax=Solimicrobium silvestre TaxID=2099400 RepID=A0A2S9GTS9_9BURK|nr:HDOD domain [Solimicrobium silvestre]
MSTASSRAAAKLAKLAKSLASSKHAAPKNEFLGNYKQLPSYVDARYFDWMAGKSTGNVVEDSSFERKLIEYLAALAASEFAGSNLIPRVPSVMVQLLKRMHEENVSGSELSRIITKDVVLVAAILSEVNSSFYNLSDRINDLSQAILLLGHNRLRMVLAKISFTPIYNAQLGAYTKLTAAKIWEESQKRAFVCYLLAKHQKVDPFMAFLAGLMQDVGLMVALRVFDRSSGSGQLPTSPTFRDEFQQQSMVLSARIGHIWSLPEVVIKAIEGQGMDKTALAKIPLAKVLQKGDFLSKTCVLIDSGQLNVDMERVRGVLTEAEMDCLFTLLEGNKNVSNIL